MATVPDAATVSQLPLFAGLPPDQLARLTPHLHALTLPAGATLMHEGQPAEALYVLVLGTAKVEAIEAGGRPVILALLGPGDLLGELSVLEQTTRTATVVALEETQLLWLDRATVQQALQRLPLLTLNLAHALARRLCVTNAQLRALATQDVFGRVARQLLALAEAYGEPTPSGAVRLPLRLTQSELAALVGASRVRVNQVLVAYQEQGYLSSDPRQHLTLHDVAALARRCQ